MDEIYVRFDEYEWELGEIWAILEHLGADLDEFCHSKAGNSISDVTKASFFGVNLSLKPLNA